MLILTRKIGESIMIGDNIVVNIISSNGSNIRVGVDAPREIPVHREEVYKRILKERDEVIMATGALALKTG
jgi:carbon storage regulator